jgi:hypothetical protein
MEDTVGKPYVCYSAIAGADTLERDIFFVTKIAFDVRFILLKSDILQPRSSACCCLCGIEPPSLSSVYCCPVCGLPTCGLSCYSATLHPRYILWHRASWHVLSLLLSCLWAAHLWTQLLLSYPASQVYIVA